MKLISLDTNVILRLVLNDVPQQAAIAEKFVKTSRCYVTDVVIAETVFVLEKVYGLSRATVVELVSNVLKLKTVIHNEYLVKPAFELFEKVSRLSFVDCYSAIEASLYENELATFDKHLIKKGGSHITEPK